MMYNTVNKKNKNHSLLLCTIAIVLPVLTSTALAEVIEERIPPIHQVWTMSCWAASIQFIIDYYAYDYGAVIENCGEENHPLEQCKIIMASGEYPGINCCNFPGLCNGGLSSDFAGWGLAASRALYAYDVDTATSYLLAPLKENPVFSSALNEHAKWDQPALMYWIGYGWEGHAVVGRGVSSDKKTVYIMDPAPIDGSFAEYAWTARPFNYALTTEGYSGIDCSSGGDDCGGETCGSQEECCNDTCVNIYWDEANCGGCGNPCTAEQKCCSGLCKNIQWDEANCGDCGHPCQSNTECQNGYCECVDNTTLCGDECVFLASDPDNCGECGRQCPTGHGKCGYGYNNKGQKIDVPIDIDGWGYCYNESGDSLSICIDDNYVWITEKAVNISDMEVILTESNTFKMGNYTNIVNGSHLQIFKGQCN